MLADHNEPCGGGVEAGTPRLVGFDDETGLIHVHITGHELRLGVLRFGKHDPPVARIELTTQRATKLRDDLNKVLEGRSCGVRNGMSKPPNTGANT